jgi:hypothetical protein
VQISVSNANDAEGFKFEVHYSPNLLDVAGVSWDAWGTGTVYIDEVNGNITCLTSGNPFGADARLVTITFNASSPHLWKNLQGWTNDQSGEIYVRWANLSYSGGSDLAYVRTSLNQIEVSGDVAYAFSPIKGDINNDGTVDIVDLSNEATHYDQINVGYNLVGDTDNLVDIFDLVVVASNFWYAYTPPTP